MIKGVHTMFFSSEAEAMREFIRDKLGFSFTDVGDGWLIFNLPEADMGCHPSDSADGQQTGPHQISIYCDDIKQTVAELTARGVQFTSEIEDRGYGLVTHFQMPGNCKVQLYEPKYVKQT